MRDNTMGAWRVGQTHTDGAGTRHSDTHSRGMRLGPPSRGPRGPPGPFCTLTRPDLLKLGRELLPPCLLVL